MCHCVISYFRSSNFSAAYTITSCVSYETTNYCNMARILGLSTINEITTVRALVSWCEFMNKEMSIPLTISAIGTIDKEEYFKTIPQMAQAALRDACTATNPRTPTLEEIEALYASLWG